MSDLDEPMQNAASGDDRRTEGVPAERRRHEDDPDVMLDVPQLRVDEISLEVEDLRARVSLQADVLELLNLQVGVDAALGHVELTIKGVEAQVLLKVHLDNVARILDRVLTTIDNHPEIVERLVERVGAAVEGVGTSAGEAVGELGAAAGSALGEVGEGAGAALEDVGRGTASAVDAVGEGAQTAVEGLAGKRPRDRDIGGDPRPQRGAPREADERVQKRRTQSKEEPSRKASSGSRRRPKEQ
jgi:hypothetical protein